MNNFSHDEIHKMFEKAWYTSIEDASYPQLLQSLEMSCKTGNLNSVKHLLNKTLLKHYSELQAGLDMGLRNAAERRHLEVVKYLLTSNDLSIHANIHANNDYSFRQACLNKDIEMVRFLACSPELKEHSNIHYDDDIGFRFACLGGINDVVKFFIFEMNIKKTPEIEEYLNSKNFVSISKLFEKRELNHELNESLLSDKKEQNRNKNKI